MSFSRLLRLLIEALRDRIRHGEFTERGLARRAGISQPHLHNVLNGRREMSVRTADSLLEAVGITIAGLLDRSAQPRDKPREPADPSLPD